MGFCGLDRRREPLRGDEVRACWEDGALALPPEPSIPGLLDLLTVGALGESAPADPEPLASIPHATEALPSPPPRPVPPVHRLRSITSSREWVEVDV